MTASVRAGLITPARAVAANVAEKEDPDMYPDREKVQTLQDMAPDEHVDEAYALLATKNAWEQEAINATLAVAHLLLADRKDRQAVSLNATPCPCGTTHN